MNNYIMIGIVLVVALMAGYWLRGSDSITVPLEQIATSTLDTSITGTQTPTTPATSPTKTSGSKTLPEAKDFKNATYLIEGGATKLISGRSEVAIPGSASKTITQIVGDEGVGDLNGDKLPDIALIVSKSSGGTGTFYYVAAALKTLNGYRGTNAVLIGDRIAPKMVQISKGEVIVNYWTRLPSEPMSAEPTTAASMYFKLSGGLLVVRN